MRSREEALASGSAASFLVTTPTALSALATPEAVPHVTIERCSRATGRPAGKRFGVLVHQTLQAIALDADDAGIGELCRAVGRLCGASAEEVDAAAERGGMRREAPVTWAAPRRGHRRPVAAEIAET